MDPAGGLNERRAQGPSDRRESDPEGAGEEKEVEGPQPECASGNHPLDPLDRVLLQQGPRLSSPPAAVLDQLAQQLVRRCSVQGDGRSGKVRLELGGALERSVVELVFDGGSGQLRVDVEVPNDAPPEVERFLRGLEGHLRDRGLPLEGFELSSVSSVRSPGAPGARLHP